VHRKEVVTGTGSRFLLCKLSQTDRRFPKYPPQPIVDCPGFETGVLKENAPEQENA